MIDKTNEYKPSTNTKTEQTPKKITWRFCCSCVNCNKARAARFGSNVNLVYLK